MALPIEFRNQRLEYLENEARKYGPHEFGNLTDDDFMLIGKYIQTYCFIELNMHRLFNDLRSIGEIKTKSNDKINFPYIMEKLTLLISSIQSESSKIDSAIDKLKEIQLRKDYRNIFAHWAAKRIPNEDGIIFFAGDALDYKKALNKKIEPGVVAYAIFDVADIRGLIAHMKNYEEWMAHFYVEIYNRKKKTPSII